MVRHKRKDREQNFQQVREQSTAERPYHVKMQLVNEKLNYIRNLINGRYFLARYNMIANQLLDKNIQEKIDGFTKTEEYMTAEAALVKMQAMNSMRLAHFGKRDLIETFGLTNEEIVIFEDDYYNGKILREAYDEELNRPGKKAEFVKTEEE